MEIVKQLHAALMDAFTIDDMDQLLRFEFDPPVEMESVVGSGGSKNAQFFDVIEWAARNSKLSDLAHAAYRIRSGNEKIRVFFETYGKINFAPNQATTNNPYVIDESPTQTLRDRVREIELLLRGFDGNNGFQSQLKELRREVAEMQKTLNQVLARLDRIESPGPSSSIIWRIILSVLLILVSSAAFITIAAQFGIIELLMLDSVFW